MTRVQLAVFPAILFGIFLIIGVTSIIGKPIPTVQAATGYTASPDQAEVIPAKSQAKKNGAPGTGGKTTPGETAPVNVAADNGDQAGGDTQSPDGCSLNDRYAASVLQWCDLIEQYAGENGLEAGLVAALITQESGGDPNAYSHSGAVGLMQVMPSDGIAAGFMCVSGPCFTNRPTSQELQDPEYNISYGTKMLAGLLNKYGSIRDALLYYGPMNVGYYYADLVLGIFDSHQ